jgi:acetoin:2,6-dichlorophenolindophenol oxidoreductase subunit alpha
MLSATLTAAMAFLLVGPPQLSDKGRASAKKQAATARRKSMAEPARANLDAERLLAHYRMMSRIRAFEEAAEAALRAGEVKGAIHLSIGQEAIAAGVCANLRRSDLIASNHRGHGHTLAKGAAPAAMMAELFGRATGACQGKGGSMHIADFDIGMLGANGVVGAGILIAVGAAQGVRLRREDRIVACFFGDGAINRGPFLEGLNWAKIYALPVLFVCEDNGFAAMTRTAALSAGGGPDARAESLGIPATLVDGNDVAAVDEAARALAERIRRGGGPHFLLARTYRLKGHTAADAAGYRSAEEVAARQQDEPLGRCAEALLLAGSSEAALAAIAAAARREMADAVAAARAAPSPPRALAWSDVQDVGSPQEARR